MLHRLFNLIFLATLCCELASKHFTFFIHSFLYDILQLCPNLGQILCKFHNLKVETETAVFVHSSYKFNLTLLKENSFRKENLTTFDHSFFCTGLVGNHKENKITEHKHGLIVSLLVVVQLFLNFNDITLCIFNLRLANRTTFLWLFFVFLNCWTRSWFLLIMITSFKVATEVRFSDQTLVNLFCLFLSFGLRLCGRWFNPIWLFLFLSSFRIPSCQILWAVPTFIQLRHLNLILNSSEQK